MPGLNSHIFKYNKPMKILLHYTINIGTHGNMDWFGWFMVLSATFNNISIISRRRVSCIGGGNRIDNSKCFDKIYAKYAVGKT